MISIQTTYKPDEITIKEKRHSYFVQRTLCKFLNRTLDSRYYPIAQVKISQNIEKRNHLNRRIATAIEDLPRLDALDRRHFCSELSLLRKKRRLALLFLRDERLKWERRGEKILISGSF